MNYQQEHIQNPSCRLHWSHGWSSLLLPEAVVAAVVAAVCVAPKLLIMTAVEMMAIAVMMLGMGLTGTWRWRRRQKHLR